MVDTVSSVFSFPQECPDGHMKERSYFPNPQYTLSSLSRKIPLLGRRSSSFKFPAAYLAPNPAMIKNESLSTELVMSEDSVAQAAGPRLFIFESHLLPLKPTENNLDLRERHEFSRVAGKEATIV